MMRSTTAALLAAAILFLSACSESSSQSVDAGVDDDAVSSEEIASPTLPETGSDDATAESDGDMLVVGGEDDDSNTAEGTTDSTTEDGEPIGSTNRVPDSSSDDGTGTTVTTTGSGSGSGDSSGSGSGSGSGGTGIAPPTSVPTTATVAIPEVELGDVEVSQVACYAADLEEQTGVDITGGRDASELDLSDPALSEAIQLQLGFYPGQSVMASSRCLDPDARYDSVKGWFLLQNSTREQFDCAWPDIEDLGEVMVDNGWGLNELLADPNSNPQIRSVFTCLGFA